MSTIENIIKEIMNQAQAQGDKAVSRAKERAEVIRKNEEQRRADWAADFDAHSATEASLLDEQLISADRQKRRRSLLETRNQVIEEIITEIQSGILAFPVEEYFAFLYKLFEQEAQDLDGIIRFGTADINRVPGDFVSRCQKLFPTHTLTLSNEPANMTNGFELQYGNVYHNCSVEGYFKTEKQVLRDKVNEILAS